MNESKIPGEPQDVVCPHEFTGNADDQWSAWFVQLYQFAEWANKNCLEYFTEEDYANWNKSTVPPAGKPQITYKVLGYPKDGYNSGDFPNGMPDPLPAGYAADGIEIFLHGGWSVGNELVANYHHVIAQMPHYWPDGDLEFTNQPGDDRQIIRLWHD